MRQEEGREGGDELEMGRARLVDRLTCAGWWIGWMGGLVERFRCLIGERWTDSSGKKV